MRWNRPLLKMILMVCVGYTAPAQNLEWVSHFSCNLISEGKSVTTDALGNSYTAGYFTGTADFDPGPGVYNLTQAGGAGAYIVKLSASGNLIWAKQLESWNIIVHSITLDASGNIYTTGYFQQIADFDPGPGVFNLTTGLGADAFISKLDNNGNFVWARKITSIANNQVTSYQVVVDGSDNVIITGDFNGIADFDPGPSAYMLTASVMSDAYILKLNASGDFVWASQIRCSNNAANLALTVDVFGNIYTSGHFSGVVDVDPGPGIVNLTSSPGGLDFFVCKLDALGNLIWGKNSGGSWQIISTSIAVNSVGQVMVTGGFRDMIDADPGPGVLNFISAGDVDTYVITLDQMGNMIWAKQFGGTGQDRIKQIKIGTEGDLFICGDFQNVVDFDPGIGILNLSSAGGYDAFIARLNTMGNLIWARKVGGPGDEMGQSIARDFLGNVFVTGFFNLVADFDPGPGVYNLTSGGSDNGFMLKLSHCVGATSSTLNITSCNSYTLNNQTYNSSGTYVQTLLNAAGCDSIITLNLIIGGSNTTTSITACDSYFWEGQTFNSGGNYSVTYLGQDGCDSILNLNLVINNSTYSTNSVTICEGLSFEGYSVSGTYIDIFTAANGCDSTRTLHLTVNPRSFTTINAVICEGNSFEGYNASGTYIDTYTGINGCDSTRTLNLVVNPTKFTSISAAICEGEFYFAGGALQTISGIYKDTLLSITGCDSIITTNLIVHQKPKPLLGEDSGLCFGASKIFNPGIFSTYLWQDNSTGPVFSTSSVGQYWVTVTDQNNCTGSDSVSILRIDPLPSGFLKASDSICSYEKLLLKPVENFASYVWSTGSTENNITVQVAGEYWLMVTDINGCTARDTILVIPKSCNTGVFFPSAFTPNGDNLNDVFKPIVRGKLISFQLEIYDRGGQPVFKTTNADSGWDGKVKGTHLTSSVLVWQCFYQLEGVSPQYAKGIVTLIK